MYAIRSYYVLLIVVGAWGALWLTSSALLIGGGVTEARKPEQGDRIDAETVIGALSQITSGGKVLECKYFTGTGLLRRVEPYDENGAFGRAVCPRLISLV